MASRPTDLAGSLARRTTMGLRSSLTSRWCVGVLSAYRLCARVDPSWPCRCRPTGRVTRFAWAIRPTRTRPAATASLFRSPVSTLTRACATTPTTSAPTSRASAPAATSALAADKKGCYFSSSLPYPSIQRLLRKPSEDTKEDPSMSKFIKMRQRQRYSVEEQSWQASSCRRALEEMQPL
jgi:hypothetical protein